MRSLGKYYSRFHNVLPIYEQPTNKDKAVNLRGNLAYGIGKIIKLLGTIYRSSNKLYNYLDEERIKSEGMDVSRSHFCIFAYISCGK